jgi:hypothetical protein
MRHLIHYPNAQAINKTEKRKPPWLDERQSSEPEPKTKSNAKNCRVTQPGSISEIFMAFGSLVQRMLTRAQWEAAEPWIVAIN